MKILAVKLNGRSHVNNNIFTSSISTLKIAQSRVSLLHETISTNGPDPKVITAEPFKNPTLNHIPRTRSNTKM